MEKKESPQKIKFVIKSFIPITSEFTTVIKNSNDSSIDNLLEFRSLRSNSFKDDAKNCNNEDGNSGGGDKKDKSYSTDVKNFIKKILNREKLDEVEEGKDDSGCKSEQNDSGGSMSDLVITKKQKINECDGGSPAAFGKMSSSTPIKQTAEQRNMKLDISGVGFLSFIADDKAPSLNDSDFESMDQDQYDESAKHERTTKDDLTLVNISNPEIPRVLKSSSLSDLKNGLRLILEETVRRTPVAIRRAFKLESSSDSSSSTSLKKSKFLNIFSSTKKLKRKQSPGKKRHSRRLSSCKKKFQLTKENLRKHLKEDTEDKENLVWGDDFGYSFTCEPASSDVDENENSPNYISFNTSLDSSIEMMKSPLVPTFKVDPPKTSQSDLCPPAIDYVRHMIKCSYASRLSLSTSATLRRSISEPAVDDGLDSTEFAFSHANTTKTNEAAVKNLTQLSVSIKSSLIPTRFVSRLLNE